MSTTACPTFRSTDTTPTPQQEDTDRDGHDDGDEVRDGRGSTNVRLADHDGIASEDEDDAGRAVRRGR